MQGSPSLTMHSLTLTLVSAISVCVLINVCARLLSCRETSVSLQGNASMYVSITFDKAAVRFWLINQGLVPPTPSLFDNMNVCNTYRVVLC